MNLLIIPIPNCTESLCRRVDEVEATILLTVIEIMGQKGTSNQVYLVVNSGTELLNCSQVCSVILGKSNFYFKE